MPDRALLTALSAESADMRLQLEGLAAMVGDLVRGLPADARGAILAEVQAFDALGQRLEALSAVLGGLARGEEGAGLVAAVPLADMAARLTGAAAPSAAPAGDLVLFE